MWVSPRVSTLAVLQRVLDSGRDGRRSGKWIAQTNVPTDEGIRRVASLRLDAPGRGACPRGIRHEADAQRMSGVSRRIEANRPDSLLHDQRDGVARELTGQHMPALGDRPEHRPCADPGQLEPLVERLNWTDRVSAAGDGDLPRLTFLVGLALRNGDNEPAG